MSSKDLFGWDLLYKTIETKISKESDVLIALTHWFLVRNSLLCLGVGDDKTLGQNEEGTELLPDGWNDNETYTLRYVFNGNLYNLIGATTEGTLVINLLDIKTKNVSNIAFATKETVLSLCGGIRMMVPQINEILDRFQRELIDPVFPGNRKAVTTQTHCLQTSENRQRIFPRNFSSDTTGINRTSGQPSGFDPLRDVGRGDLNPLGRGSGGGMIFSPPSLNPFAGNLGPNSFPDNRNIPPGARFDPFTPPDGTGRINPNATHFRPPPDFDDMYM